MIIVETDMFTFQYDGDNEKDAIKEAKKFRQHILKMCKKYNINYTYYLEEFHEV